MAQMSDRLATTFRRKVRERMAALGLTQAQLASKLKVTPSFVSQMLSGHRNPGLESLEEFAKALGIDASDLIRGESEKKSRQPVLTRN